MQRPIMAKRLSEPFMAIHPDPQSPRPDVPGTSDPAFIEECRRQSKTIRDNAAAEAADLDFIERVSEDPGD